MPFIALMRGTPGAVSFEHLLGWLDQLMGAFLGSRTYENEDYGSGTALFRSEETLV
jgi:hypothetical protein